MPAAAAPLPTSQPQASSTTASRSHAVNIFGGSQAQRENVASRLARLPEWHTKLKYESIAICLLTEGLFHESVRTEASTYNEQSVGRASSSSSTASSGPLAQAFLQSDLLGTIITIFHVDSHEKRQLLKAHGNDVLRSWAKDTLRQHLASMGSVGATGLILEPVLMDLAEQNSDEAHEDDAVLAKALTQKVSLKTTALPGTLIPAKHASKLVLLVFPRRETRPSEGLHRGKFPLPSLRGSLLFLGCIPFLPLLVHRNPASSTLLTLPSSHPSSLPPSLPSSLQSNGFSSTIAARTSSACRRTTWPWIVPTRLTGPCATQKPSVIKRWWQACPRARWCWGRKQRWTC